MTHPFLVWLLLGLSALACPPGTYQALNPVPAKVPLPVEFKDSLWEPGVAIGRVELDGVVKPGDKLVERFALPPPLENAGAKFYGGTAKLEYGTERTIGDNAAGDFEIQYGVKNGKTTLSLKRAFLDGETFGPEGLIPFPRRVSTPTGSHRTSSLVLRQLTEAVTKRHGLARPDEFFLSEVVNFSTTLKLLEAELKWRRANPLHPKTDPVPKSVYEEAFRGSVLDKFATRAMADAGYRIELGTDFLSGGRNEPVKKSLTSEDGERRTRTKHNREQWEAFKERLAKEDAALAAQLTDDTPMFGRFYVQYTVKP